MSILPKLATDLNLLISTKKGFNNGLGKCKQCGNGMRIKTLFALGKWTPEEYAKFVVEYPFGAFWAKLSVSQQFEAWKKKLSLMNWSQPFWLEYRRLNPKYEEEKEELSEQTQNYDNYDRDLAKREFEERQRQAETDLAIRQTE